MSKSVKIGNLLLGEGIPKICVPIVEKTEEGVLASAETIAGYRPDMIEWRIDFLPDVLQTDRTAELLKKVKALCGDIPLLVTFRTKKEGGEQEIFAGDYRRLCEKILETGLAQAIDVEAFFRDGILEELARRAHQCRVKVIASNHDFAATPARQEMERRLRFMQEAGADIVKIAVMPKSPRDVLALLAATETVAEEGRTPVISMSMGGKGMVSRLLGENFGSCLTFAAVGKASAPGQIPIGQLRMLLDTIHQYS